MTRVSAYIRQSLQDLYPPQELKSLVMMICCDMLGMDALDIYLGKDINLSESKQHELENILLRLRKNEPIQYIRGVASFLGRPFQVAPGVLIPRPETAELVELIISENKNRFIRILDVGTGSGCIAVSLSLEGYKDVVAWDISDDALAIARTNNEVLGANVLFEKKDVFADQSIGSAKFDIIDPLCFYRCIAILGRELLTGEGQLYFEINRAYGVETVSMLTDLGYRNPRIIKDISGNDRIVTAYK